MTSNAASIPPEQAKEIRRLSHDLSNALEIIVQANYLLGAMTQDQAAKQWVKLLDSGVLQGLRDQSQPARLHRRQQRLASRTKPTWRRA